MKSILQDEIRKASRSQLSTIMRLIVFALVLAAPGYAQSPWELAVNNLQQSFTGPIAKGLSLVAIVIGGLTFAYSEGGSKKVLAGIVFGIGMAVSAASFLAWMFGA